MSQKSNFLKLANEAAQLMSGSAQGDEEEAKLKKDLAQFRKLLSQIKPGKVNHIWYIQIVSFDNMIIK